MAAVTGPARLSRNAWRTRTRSWTTSTKQCPRMHSGDVTVHSCKANGVRWVRRDILGAHYSRSQGERLRRTRRPAFVKFTLGFRMAGVSLHSATHCDHIRIAVFLKRSNSMHLLSGQANTSNPTDHTIFLDVGSGVLRSRRQNSID